MSFYARSHRVLSEASAPRDMNPLYWEWVAARSDDERRLRAVSAGDVEALRHLLRQIERSRPVKERDLPFSFRDVREQVLEWPTLPKLDRTFLSWAYRFMVFLRVLAFNNTGITDLSPLAPLKSLRALNLFYTAVRDLSPLKGLASLKVLHLNNTQVRDLSPLSDLQSLQSLYLNNTRVIDLSPLTDLGRLETLSLRGTSVSDDQVARLQSALPELEVYR